MTGSTGGTSHHNRPICGAHHDSWDVTGIVCEMPAGHSGHEHGANVWSGWFDDSETTVIAPVAGRDTTGSTPCRYCTEPCQGCDEMAHEPDCKWLTVIAAQATTTEREHCAQLAETEAQYWTSHGNTIQAATLRVFADLIRKRGAQ